MKSKIEIQKRQLEDDTYYIFIAGGDGDKYTLTQTQSLLHFIDEMTVAHNSHKTILVSELLPMIGKTEELFSLWDYQDKWTLDNMKQIFLDFCQDYWEIA